MPLFLRVQWGKMLSSSGDGSVSANPAPLGGRLGGCGIQHGPELPRVFLPSACPRWWERCGEKMVSDAWDLYQTR